MIIDLCVLNRIHVMFVTFFLLNFIMLRRPTVITTKLFKRLFTATVHLFLVFCILFLVFYLEFYLFYNNILRPTISNKIEK